MRHYLRLQLWNLLPNRRRAHFFDLWAGRKNTEAFHHDLHRDLTELFGLLAAGTLTSPIDSTYSLADAGIALRRAENGGIAGKIILRRKRDPPATPHEREDPQSWMGAAPASVIPAWAIRRQESAKTAVSR